MAGADGSLEEAAADLYAGRLTRFRQITLPQVWPAIAAAFMLAFSLSMDNTIISSFVSVAGSSPWPVYVLSAVRAGLRPEVAALSTCLLALTVVSLALVGAVLRQGSAQRQRRREGCWVTDTDLLARYRSKSLWLDQLGHDLRVRPPLEGDIDADVTIVGAGYTGLWAAYYLASLDPSLRIVVVEQAIVGFGASGRNGGWAGAGIAGSAARYARTAGWDSVRRGVAEMNAGVDEIGRVVSEEGISCAYRKAGTVVLARSEPQRLRLNSWFDGERDRGLLTDGERLLNAVEAGAMVAAAGVVSGFFTPHCAAIDPARLARGLADACEARGVVILEDTRATSIRASEVATERGRIRAPVVLRTTESYTALLPGERRTYLPLSSQVIATEPLDDAVWSELGWSSGLTIRDRHHLFFYAQRTADDRLVIGGRGAPYSLTRPFDESRERVRAVRDRLAETLASTFPAAAGAAITHHWGGTLAVPRDWCMAVRFDPRSGLGMAGGYSGHGVVAANVAGRTLADLVLGRRTPLVSLPWVGHDVRAWEPEPLRYLASRLIVGLAGSADSYEDRHGRRARRMALVAPFLPPA